MLYNISIYENVSNAFNAVVQSVNTLFLMDSVYWIRSIVSVCVSDFHYDPDYDYNLNFDRDCKI